MRTIALMLFVWICAAFNMYLASNNYANKQYVLFVINLISVGLCVLTAYDVGSRLFQ